MINKNFYEFLKDFTDNDTLIILGLLIVFGFVAADVQILIVGGLLATLKSKGAT